MMHATQEFSSFAYVRDDGVINIRLNRPQKRNCLTRAFWRELPLALDQAARDPDARCVLLDADGDMFTAGIDIEILQFVQGQGAQMEEARKADYIRRTVLSLQASVNALARCPLPVVAAIQGPCLGGGLDLVSAVDVRLAEVGTQFAPMELNLGFVPDLGTVQRLSAYLPPAWIADWLFTARVIDGSEALRIGYVSRVAESAEQLQTLGWQVARQIAANSPLALRGLKDTMSFARAHGVEAGLRYVAAWQGGYFPGADFDEAMQARSAKRAPRFEPLPNDQFVFGAFDCAEPPRESGARRGQDQNAAEKPA